MMPGACSDGGFCFPSPRREEEKEEGKGEEKEGSSSAPPPLVHGLGTGWSLEPGIGAMHDRLLRQLTVGRMGVK